MAAPEPWLGWRACNGKATSRACEQELAALEAEADAQALQEQRWRSAPSPPRSNANSRGGDSISLNDGASQAERAMVGMHINFSALNDFGLSYASSNLTCTLLSRQDASPP